MRRTIDVQSKTITQGRDAVTIPMGDDVKTIRAIQRALPPSYIDFIRVVGDASSGASVDLPHGFNTEVRFYPVDFMPYSQLGAFPIIERRISSGVDLSDKNTLRLVVWYDGEVSIRVETV